MDKKKLVVSYKNLSDELLELFKKRYPHGYLDQVIKVTKPNNEYFHAVSLETEDASYLVKVNVKIDSKPKEDDEDSEKDYFSESDSFGTDSDDFPEDIEDEDQGSGFADDEFDAD